MIAYAITDSATLNFSHIEKDLQFFSSKASMIVYRDKKSTKYSENAKLFLKHAHNFDKVLLHSDYKLAKVLLADGVHLTSKQFDVIQEAKALGLFVVISTHTSKDIALAEALGADMVTLSPIFYTPNKGKALGIEMLKQMVSQYTIPILALGGIINQERMDACKEVGAKGFASIGYFKR